MDEYWDRTPSHFIKNKPVGVVGGYKCAIPECEFKADQNRAKIHFELKHPQSLAFYFDFPRYVLPVIARNKESLRKFLNYDEFFKPEEIKEIHISQVKFGYLCPHIPTRKTPALFVDNIKCDERRIYHKFLFRNLAT